MTRIVRLATLAGMLVAMLGLGATRAAAASISYDFNVSNGFTGAGSAPYGKLTLTQFAVDDVLVTVDLYNGLQFVTAFQLTVGFNLDGIGSVTMTGLPASWTIPDEVGAGTGVQNAGAYNIDGFGQFEFGLNAPGSGGNNPQGSPLTFHVQASGLTLASFAELSSLPPGDTRAYFAADVIGAGANAGTGAIAVTGTPRVIEECFPNCVNDLVAPEPGSLILLGSGLAFVAFQLRRKSA